MTNTTPPDLTHTIATAIGVPLVTHYVIVAATIDDNGHEALHTIAAPGQHYWMTHGLLATEASSYLPQPFWTLEDDDE